MPAMRIRSIGWLALLLASVVVGCDSVEDAEAYAGVVEVSLAQPGDVAGLALHLVAIEDLGCERELLVSLEARALTRRVEVEGLGAETPCRALIPASAIVELELGPALTATYDIEVVHAGATDLYRLDISIKAPTLTAVRTSTTRLAGGLARSHGGIAGAAMGQR